MNAITKEQTTALSLPERAAVALGAAEHEVKLRELVKSSADIVAVIDPAGREQAHRIGMNLKNARVAIKNTSEAARADAVAFGKAVIAEEKRLIEIASAEETRIFALRDAWDDAEKARKDAEIAAERARVEAIASAIQKIRDLPLMAVGKSSADISALIGGLVSREPDASFEEFIEQAKAARLEALDKLATMETEQRGVEIEVESQRQEAARQALAAEEVRKAEAARIEAERVELARQRAENERIANEQAAERQRLAEQQAAQEAAAAKLREQVEANLRQEREAQETQMRLQREAAEKAQAEAQAEIERARNELAAQQAAHAAAIKQQQDDAQREVDHAEALEMNATLDAAIARIEPVEKFASDDLARCNAMIDTARADAGLPLPECYDVRDEMINAGLIPGDEEPTIDYEAIAWAYKKLLAFGVGNGSIENAMMLDRLNMMLLTAHAA